MKTCCYELLINLKEMTTYATLYANVARGTLAQAGLDTLSIVTPAIAHGWG